MSKIKILVTYPSKHKIIKNDFCEPIQIGKKFTNIHLSDVLSDDSGENISVLYPYYSEITAMYWAWKNFSKIGTDEYIGFMHYNKHFILNECFTNNETLDNNLYGFSCYTIKKIDNDYYNNIGLDKKNITLLMNKYDVLCIKKGSLKVFNFDDIETEFFQKIKSLSFSEFSQIISDLFPDYKVNLSKIGKMNVRYFHNMFIMNKELFFDYSNFLFSILDVVYSKIFDENSKEECRGIFSYLSEVLFTIYILNQQKTKNISVKEVYSTHIIRSFYDEDIYPIWATNKTVISCGCSDLYAPYLGVYLQSICDKSKQKNKYDIVVLENDISEQNKEKLLQITSAYKNISLRFYNVDSLFAGIDLPISDACFAKQCYYRLALGKLFIHYDKAIFTDIDIVVNEDINNLFNINIGDYPIAACEEILWTKENRKGKIQLGKDIDQYVTQEVKCSDKYYNTGVIIVNISKFNEIASFEKLLSIALDNKFINQEQCCLNQVFDGKFYTLPSIYNFEIYEGIYNQNNISYKEYMKYIDKAVIYHHLTIKKAWFLPGIPKANIWWNYAKSTPFYEEIIYKMIYFWVSKFNDYHNEVPALRNEFIKIHFPNINSHFSKNERDMKLLFVMNHLFSFQLKKYYYCFKKAFAFGQKHQKYQQKYDIVKNLIKDAKRYKKSLFKV